MEEKRGGCFGKFLKIVGGIVVGFLVLAVLAGMLNSCNSSKSKKYSSSSYPDNSFSSSVSTAKPSSTPKPSMPSTMQFGDDAEQIAKEIKETLGDYKYSWYASGYKFSMTVKMESITGDDIADLYASSPDAQNTIDTLNRSMRDANESIWARFKGLGYTDCTVVLSVVTNDDMEICTVENGKITHSITKDNFRYG